MAETTQWICKCGAVLGQIGPDGNGVPRLMLYRHAVDLTAERPEAVDVIGPLMGKMPVRCDACGDVRVWWPSAPAVLAMLDELNMHQLRQFVDVFLERWNSRLEAR